MCLCVSSGKTGPEEGCHYGPLIRRSNHHPGPQSRPQIPVSYVIIPFPSDLYTFNMDIYTENTLSEHLSIRTLIHILPSRDVSELECSQSLRPFITICYPPENPPLIALKVWDCSRLLDGAGPQRSPGDWCSTTSPLHQQLHLPVARQREEDDETDSSSAAHRSLCLHHPNTPVSSLQS